LVCLSQESGFYGKGITDATGKVNIDTTSAVIIEETTLVASYHNHFNYQDTFFLNQAPIIPAKPMGPSSGKPNEELTFSAITTDPDEDQIHYMWRWGDGSYSDWLGPFNSGDIVEDSHIWDEPSNYQVRIKAKDSTGQETDWSEPLLLNIQRSKTINMPIFSRFLQNHPNIFIFLRILINL
jgi:hypothetical protein